MHRISKRVLTIVALAAAPLCLAHPGPESEHMQAPPDALCITADVTTGAAGNVYQVVPMWCQVPDNKPDLGSPTHGGVFVDKEGLVYFTMDGGNQGIMVYTPEGKFVKSIADKYVGIHGVWLNTENGEQFIYGAWLHGKKALKLKLDGTLVWEIPVPMESGKYKDPNQYNPTGITVGPNLHVYVADGYGQNWVHEFDENQKYVKSFGGKGKGDGQFETCHGIALDTRGEKPLLLVCDRENGRLQHFDLDGNFVSVVTKDPGHRPCSVSFHGKNVAIAELDGRVAITDETNKVVSVLGENPNKGQRANFGVPPADWTPGIFNAPHGVSYDKDGNLYVEDWNKSGRISKMMKVAGEAKAE
jgi:sugar lactone lactonase YvrE